MHLLAGIEVIHDRSYWNFEQDVLAHFPGTVGPHPVLPTLSLVFRIKTKVDECIVALAGLHDDIAAIAAVPTRRPATGFERLAPERNASVAAVPGLDSNFCLIDKHKSSRSSLVSLAKGPFDFANDQRRANNHKNKKPQPEGEAARLKVWRGHSCPRCSVSKAAYFARRGLHHHKLTHAALI